ncbi:MAG: hydrogenase iron-sulfur subunit [Ardenticatenaceae bacterium]|nr:hydrogenase iron-sulfur subunit [Ardenticatenaceae bacterium]
MSPSPYPPRSKWTQELERLALIVEKIVNRLIGNSRLNPFYHTDTIAVFLLAVVGITGIYIFLFFQYGFDASYQAVATRIETPIIARIMRAIHRYASGALVITILLHAFRTLFMERFRGPRWLAWISGIVMTFILWLAGITGYWLIWDQRAQLINDHFIRFLNQATAWATAYRVALLRADVTDRSWPLLFLILLVHVVLFLIVAGFFWLHIRHLRAPRWLPEISWMAGATAVLLITALLFPLGMLPAFNFNQEAGRVLLDPIYLYYLPLVGTGWDTALWVFMWAATFIAAALPWTRRKNRTPQPTITIHDKQCTGCTKCARDCPYNAITMIPRDDDSGHQLLAVVDTAKCVGCGICVGSCDDFYAIQLGEQQPDAAKQRLDAHLQQAKSQHPDKDIKVVFTCQRHAAQGAKPYLPNTVQNDLVVEIIDLPCSGAIQPSLLPYALAQGAAEVEVAGCPPYDCMHRMGNMLEEQRVTNERVPRLRKRYDNVPITAVWLPPDDFDMALSRTPIPTSQDESGNSQPDYVTGRSMMQWLSWRNLVVGGVLLGFVLLAQIWLTGLPYTSPASPTATIQLTLDDPATYFFRRMGGAAYEVRDRLTGDEIEVVLAVDEEVVWTAVYPAADFFSQTLSPTYEEFSLAPGSHHIHLYWTDTTTHFTDTISDQQVTLQAGQILRVHDLLPN